MLCQLLFHHERNTFWQVFQSAYRSHRSRETALLRICNDLLIAIDSDQISFLTLLGRSAAFDTTDHILLRRLRHIFRIQETALLFFESYVKKRLQIVSIHGHDSEISPLLYGVPQGSVLGPVLFVLYTQPLSDIMDCHSVLHHMLTTRNCASPLIVLVSVPCSLLPSLGLVT